MTTSTVRVTVVALLMTLLLSACGDEPAADTSSGASAAGEVVYAASCASCHGADLRGTDKGPSQLSIVYEPNHHGDDAYRSAIANGAPQHHWGFGDMPAVDGLSAQQVEDVIAYIRAEQERNGFER